MKRAVDPLRQTLFGPTCFRKGIRGLNRSQESPEKAGTGLGIIRGCREAGCTLWSRFATWRWRHAKRKALVHRFDGNGGTAHRILPPGRATREGRGMVPVHRQAPVIVMAASIAGFGFFAFVHGEEDEDEVDHEIVVTGTRPPFCQREGNFMLPECHGGGVEAVGVEDDVFPGGGGGNGGGEGPPANAQDVDGDGLQDCWSALTSDEDAEITSELGYRDLDNDGQDEFHNGIDIGVATGTALYAAKSGTFKEKEIRLLEDATSYVNELGETVEVANGNFVRINWADGTQGVYLHMLSVRDFREGDAVTVGDYLGTSNNTGRSGGPHLHYSEWKNQSDSRPDGAAGNPENFNDPEETHGNCGTEDGTDEGEPEGDA